METVIWHWYFGENMETHSSLYWSFSKTSLRIRFYGYAKVSEKNFLRICFYGFAKYLGFHTNLEMFSYNFSEKSFLVSIRIFLNWSGSFVSCHSLWILTAEIFVKDLLSLQLLTNTIKILLHWDDTSDKSSKILCYDVLWLSWFWCQNLVKRIMS